MAIRPPYGELSLDMGYDDYYLELPRREDPKRYEYVVGFMFTLDRKSILLIKKTHPEWQAGKLNGTGGKPEEGELIRDCMVREHLEETGIDTTPQQWGHFATLEGSDWRVYYFHTFDDKAHNARQTTDEEVKLMRVSSVGNVSWAALATTGAELIYNLKWLIPLSLDETIKFPVVIGDNVP